MAYAGIEFKEEWQPQKFVPKKGWGEKLTDALVKYSGGLIRNETQATYVIICLVGVVIIISLFLFFKGGTKQPSPENIIEVAGPAGELGR